MGWVWIVAVAWIPLAFGVALVLGRSVRLADRKAADTEADAVNFVVDRPPLTIVPPKTVNSSSKAPEPSGPPLPTPPAGRGAPTIPGLPSARPPVGRPPVPASARPRFTRRSGLG
jgi:hypothetical protein